MWGVKNESPEGPCDSFWECIPTEYKGVEYLWQLGFCLVLKVSLKTASLKSTHLIFDKGGKTIQWRKNSLFNNWCWENWSTTCKRMKLEHFLIPYTKINSNWIKDLNVSPETIKLLEENIGKTLSEINHGRILYDPPPRVMEIKANINKWNLMKLKSFCSTKETISKVKRQPSEWEKNNSKRSNWQRINLKNIQAAPVPQFQKNKQPNQNMGQRTKQIFLQRRHTDG